MVCRAPVYGARLEACVRAARAKRVSGRRKHHTYILRLKLVEFKAARANRRAIWKFPQPDWQKCGWRYLPVSHTGGSHALFEALQETGRMMFTSAVSVHLHSIRKANRHSNCSRHKMLADRVVSIATGMPFGPPIKRPEVFY